jgi:CHAT domain-containing protein
LLALGDVDYAHPAEGTHEPALAAAAAPGFVRGGAFERGFEALPGTGAEVSAIAALFAESFPSGVPARVLAGEEASREALFALAPGARFLHLATHGWFAPESVVSAADPELIDERAGLGRAMTRAEQVRGSSPMVLCGLALAGANGEKDELGRVAGLVTAEELAGLSLSSCELAVLSACETAVGVRRAGQGVASLQRALHMAGAKSVVTSLWKVSDEATRELMVELYRRIWVEGEPKAKALFGAKMQLRSARERDGRPRYATRDWAGWVLTGDPR